MLSAHCCWVSLPPGHLSGHSRESMCFHACVYVRACMFACTYVRYTGLHYFSLFVYVKNHEFIPTTLVSNWWVGRATGKTWGRWCG